MIIRFISVLRLVILTIVVGILWTATLHAQTFNFVHITDPHLFDLGDEGVENRSALTAAIKALNARLDGNANYKFAVVTGDIGIENLVSRIVNPETKERVLEDSATQARQLEEGASQLAAILAPTKVQIWLFVAGNNDLYNEEPNLQYYAEFLKRLRSKLPALEIIDLAKGDGNENTYSVGGLTMVGFNNASFKNMNDPCRLLENKTKQLGYIGQVSRHLQPDSNPALIFYHIPEVDDPHIVLNADTETPKKRIAPCKNPQLETPALQTPKQIDSGPYPDSSWFVDPEILKVWKQNVVKNTKVLGLFAGHLHDWRRENYSGSLAKLNVCPPLAAKLQSKTPSQARGFQEVAIDASGRITRIIFWFNRSDATFDPDPSLNNNELALALFYENKSEWEQAQTHFLEAAKTAQTTPARNAALAGLARVRDAQYPRLKAIFAWMDPGFVTLYILRPILLVIVIVVVAIVVMAVYEGFHAVLVHPFDGDEELAKAVAVGFPAVRAKVTKLLNPPDHIFLPQSVQFIFPFVAPRLNQLLPAQAFEFAGVKIPDLNVVLKWIVRPRFQINGGFIPSCCTTFVYAEVWRRRRNWFGLHLVTVVTREIPNGSRRRIELENFIYDVYLTTNASTSVQNARA